jgi:hypothetical protein
MDFERESRIGASIKALDSHLVELTVDGFNGAAIVTEVKIVASYVRNCPPFMPGEVGAIQSHRHSPVTFKVLWRHIPHSQSLASLGEADESWQNRYDIVGDSHFILLLR